MVLKSWRKFVQRSVEQGVDYCRRKVLLIKEKSEQLSKVGWTGLDVAPLSASILNGGEVFGWVTKAKKQNTSALPLSTAASQLIQSRQGALQQVSMIAERKAAAAKAQTA